MNTFSIPSLIVERLGWVLLHSLWQFALIAILAGATIRLLGRNSATMRYGVLCVAMAATVVVPVVTWMLQPNRAPGNAAIHAAVNAENESNIASSPAAETFPIGIPPMSPSESTDDGTTINLAEPISSADSPVHSPLDPSSDALADSSVDTPTVVSPTPPADSSDVPSWFEQATTFLRPWLVWIVAGWGVGVLMCSLRPLLGWHTLRRLRRVGVSPVSDEVMAALCRVSERLGLRRAVRVLHSTLARVPIVVGYVRPVVLLPVSLVTSIPTAQLEAILAHELAHVRRHDFLVNLLQTLVETVFFFHPAVWWLSNRLRAERENCCDDLVVDALGNRVEYGRALLAIEELRGRGRSTALALGANDGSLLARVRRILELNSQRTTISLVERAPALLGIVLIGILSTLWMTWNHAAEDDQNADQKVSADSQLVAKALSTKPPSIGPQPEFGLGQRMERVQWSHDSKQLYSTGDFNKLTLWDHQESGWVPSLLDVHHHANSIAASEKSPLIVVGTNVGTAEVWDAATRKRLSELRSSPNYSVYAVAISSDEKLIAVCGTDGTVHVFDRKSQRTVVVLGKKSPSRMASLAFSPDGKTLAAMDRHGHLVLWSLPDGKQLAQWSAVGGERCSVQWSPAGEQLAVSDWGKVTLIAAEKGSQPRIVEAPEAVCPRAPKDEGNSVRVFGGIAPGGIIFASVTAIALDLRTVASVAPDASIAIWELATRKIIQKLPAPEKLAIMDSQSCGLRHLTFSPDGLRLACTTLRGEVVFWQLAQAEDSTKQAGKKVETVPPKGLEFLTPYPKLHGLSLEMTESQFLEIVKQQELKPRKTSDGGGNHYWIPANDDHDVIVMFGNNGDKCSGIQRIRGDGKPRPARDQDSQTQKDPLLRPVSLVADNVPMRTVLERLASDAGLKIEFDVEALKQVEIDLQQPITVRFENLPLGQALGQVIDWQAHLGAMREVRGDKLVLTTVEAWQKRIAERLPEWMKPLYNNGLLATLDDNNDVVSVTTSSIATDELLAKLATLPQLQELHIEVTKKLTSQGLAQLGKMPKLEKLSLYQVNTEGPGLGDAAIRSVVGLTSLRELSIAECGTTDVGAKLLEQLPQLTTLSLRQEGRLTDEALKSIGKLSRLQSLSLDSYVGIERLGWMRFSAAAIRQLSGLKELESLHLVGQDVPADALNFPKLTSLSLGHDDVGDDVGVQIGRLRSLRNLELSYCRIGDRGLNAIAALPELRRFNISGSTVTDAGIGHFRSNKKLEHITLRVNGLTDHTLDHVAQIETLTRLDLYGSGQPGVAPGRNFSGAGLRYLKRLPKLKTLWLTNFDIPGGYAALKELTQLRELTMMMCNITSGELEALDEALPNARISHMTGGGSWVPKKPRKGAKNSQKKTTSAIPPVGPRTLLKPAFLLPGHNNMMDVRFGNKDRELVSISAYHFATVRRSDVLERKLKGEIKLVSDKPFRPFRSATLRLSGDGRHVIAATDEYVGIWDSSTGELLKKLSYPTKKWEYDCIGKLDCTSDLSVIVGHLTTHYDRTTRVFDAHLIVWDGNSGEVLNMVIDKHAAELHSIDLSADGKRLATTNGGGAKVWETRTGKLLRSFPNDNKGRKHSDPEVKGQYNDHVWSVQLSPDGKQLAVGDILGVRLWDIESGKLRHQLDAPYRYGTGSFEYSKDGQLLARTGTSSKKKGVVPIWSTQTGEKLFELQTGAHCGAFSDDNQQFAVGLSERQMALAVFQLSGAAADPPAQPSSNANTPGGLRYHHRGKRAQELIDQWKPVWGDEQLGVQYGIAITGEQRQFRVGQRVPMAIFFRNVSDKPLQVDVRPDFFWDVPDMTDASGAEIKLEKIALLGNLPHYREKLEPGEAFGAIYLSIGLGENPRPGQQDWAPYWKTPVVGQCKLKHTIAFKVGGLDASRDITSDDWKPGHLTTGTLALEIVEGQPAGDRPTDEEAAVIDADQSIAIADAVREFNAENKQLGRGLDQPALTEDEIIAFIKRDKWKSELPPLNDKEIAAFKAVAESKRLPKDSYIQVYTEERRETFVVNHLWHVRLMLPAIGHDGFVGLTIRDTKVAEEKIDPKQVAWGKPDPDGLSLGIYFSPKKDKYRIGDRVRLRLFVRNEGKKAVETTWANTSHPMPGDFTVTDETGAKVAVRIGHESWILPWISGYMSGGIASGNVHAFFVPYEISIGGDGSKNKLIGRVIDARPGQTLNIKVRSPNGNNRIPAETEPTPESDSIRFAVVAPTDAQDADKQTDERKLRQPAFVLPDHLNVMAVGFGSDSKQLVSVATQKAVTIRVWDVERKKLKREVKLESDKHGNFFLFGQLRLSEDGRRVAAIVSGQVGVWETATGKLVKMLELPKELEHGSLRGLACTPDLSLVACGRTPGLSGISPPHAHAIVWDVASGKVLQTVQHNDAIQLQSVALSHDGRWLATGGQEAGTCVWEVSTGKRLLAIPNANPDRKHPDPEFAEPGVSQVLCLSFSPNGQQLAIGDMLGVKLVDAKSGKLQHQLDAPFRLGRSGLVFSKDSQLLARTATDKTVPIWSTKVGKLLAEIPTEAHDGSFSDDGRWFAVGFTDKEKGLAVWRMRDDAAVDQGRGAGADNAPRKQADELAKESLAQQSISLSDAVRDFNAENKNLGLGLDQPPLAESSTLVPVRP